MLLPFFRFDSFQQCLPSADTDFVLRALWKTNFIFLFQVMSILFFSSWKRETTAYQKTVHLSRRKRPPTLGHSIASPSMVSHSMASPFTSHSMASHSVVSHSVVSHSMVSHSLVSSMVKDGAKELLWCEASLARWKNHYAPPLLLRDGALLVEW